MLSPYWAVMFDLIILHFRLRYKIDLGAVFRANVFAKYKWIT